MTTPAHSLSPSLPLSLSLSHSHTLSLTHTKTHAYLLADLKSAAILPLASGLPGALAGGAAVAALRRGGAEGATGATVALLPGSTDNCANSAAQKDTPLLLHT